MSKLVLRAAVCPPRQYGLFMESSCPVVAPKFMRPHHEASYGMLRALAGSFGVQQDARGGPESGQDFWLSHRLHRSRGV